MVIKNLYIFRHGETDWNKIGRLQGHTDVPLNQNGILQASTLREKIKHYPITICLTSDLSRAFQTSQLAFEGKPIKYIVSANLREANLGEAEGKFRHELTDSQDWLRWQDPNFPDFQFKGGAKKSDHLKSMKQFILDNIQNIDDDHIAISTHGGAMRLLLGSCSNAPDINTPKNCSLHLIKIQFEPHSINWFYQTEL